MDAPAAFRHQLLAALPRLRRYAHSLVFDTALADDLAQTTVERALRHWQQFEPDRDMLVWLLSIAHNAHRDAHRRDGRFAVTDPDTLQQAQDRLGGDPGTDVGLRLDLLAALRRLSTEQREPLLLVCVEQLSYAEVAAVLHIPVGTVMSRVSRARAALRLFLDGGTRPTTATAATAAAPPPLRRVV